LDESAPTLRVFNHVIAVVPKMDGTYYWLDATQEVAAFDSIPFDIPYNVLLVNMDGSYKFVKTPEPDENKDYYEINCINRVNERGDVTVDYTYGYYGVTAESERLTFKYKSPKERKQHYEAKGIELSSLDLINLNEPELPFIIKVKGSIKNNIQVLDDGSMVLSNAIGIPAHNDLTTGKSRKYPISFEAFDLVKIKLTYYFPKGYKIKKLPLEYKWETPYNTDHIQYKFEDNIFSSERQIKLKKYKIEVDHFEAFTKQALERQKYKTSISNIIFEKR
jgi:hypothetical protein